MSSCGGTVSVTVRRSTRTIRSTQGTSRTTPGPLTGNSRPRRNTTARSYSRSTRTLVMASTATSIATMTRLTTIME